MAEFAIIFISAIFVNNILLSQFLGVCPFLGVSNKLSTAAGMSMAVCFVITLATVVTYLLNSVLVACELEFLQTISFILVIAALVQMVEIILKKISPSLYAALGIFLPLITTNCAVLGVALTVVTKDYNLGEATWYAFSTSIGFGLAMVIFAGLREQLALNNVPKAFKGIPIALITASLLAMAFMGFSGLVGQSEEEPADSETVVSGGSVEVTFVQYNVGAFSKYDESGVEAITKAVKELGADVVSLNEVDSCTTRTGNVDQLAEFAKSMGAWNHHYGAAMPYKGGAYGVGVASEPSLKIVRKDVLHLSQVDGREPRALAIVEYGDFVYCSTHLDLTVDSQIAQMKEINAYMDNVYKDVTKPILIGGDFNCEPDSEPIKYMKQTWKLVTPEQVYSYPAENPIKCIDFIFLRENGKKVTVKETSIPQALQNAGLATASDHLPVALTVTIE